MKRFSRKRQSILACIRETDEHPGAETVYQQMKPLYPDLSLGTVYRNLREFAIAGEICSVGTVHGKERFDGRTDPHTHAVCVRCGKIVDVDGVILPPDIGDEAARQADFCVAYAQLRLVGLCADCRNKEKE